MNGAEQAASATQPARIAGLEDSGNKATGRIAIQKETTG
jgi:hypothetical protein